MDFKNKNPWKPEDEREHFPSVLEWWCAEAFFKSVENNKRWSLKTALIEWFEKSKIIGSISNMTLFDQDKNKHFISYSRNDTAKLTSVEGEFNVRYRDSFMKGTFPKYEMHLRNPENDIELDIKYHSESLPHWIAQDVTNGWLPMGLGFYRYGFIPKNNLSGTMKIKDKTYKIKGVGYLEHVWGNLFYENPVSNFLELKKTISIYTKLIGWWIHNHKTRIPKSIMFSTENNPLGYDWIWGVLENGWTIFYGNIMFWIMKGPATGTFILSKDGETYVEFCNVDFQYNKTRYAKDYDFFYPSDLELTARRGREKLHLRFKMTADSREYVSRFIDGKFWKGLVICEAPGVVDGYYFDGDKRVKLSGICKIEPQRQVTILGHNSLKIDFLKPPEGVGVSFDLDSNYFRKKIFTHIQLAPYPNIKFRFNRIKGSRINIT